MRSLVSGVLFSMALAAPAVAEPLSFAVNDPTGKYLVDVLFPEPPAELRQLMPALITVRDKNTLQTLQQLQTQAGNVPRERDGKADPELLGNGGLLYFADFDSDGHQDLAIRNGTHPEMDYQAQFDIYLQDPQQNQWVLNRTLTDMAKGVSGGMFSLTPQDGILHTQTDRGCCWMRFTKWKMRDGELAQLSTYTQEDVPATEFGENSSMPRGYMLRTTGDWQDGQWHEQPSLEGPINDDPQMLAGTLNGKIPVELWYQEQGAVIIGEVRYTKGGNGAPIKLVGAREDISDDNFGLHEYADDGRQTGIWRLTQERVKPFNYTGTWVSGAKGDDRELAIQLHYEQREPEYAKLSEVERNQRNGHYQMRRDFLGRDGDLDLKILPDRDAQGREVAEFTVTLKDAATLKDIATEHHTVPMEAENLIIVREPQASKLNGPYHIQLVKNFAVINYNAAPDSQDMLTGMYRKQP